MATVLYTVSNVQPGVKIVTWASLATGDDGTPFISPYFADKCVQVTGTFGGSTIVIEGTNFESTPTYATLADPQGNALSFTTATIEQILENTYQVRPRVTGGSGVSLTVRLLVSTPIAYSNFIADAT